MTPADVYALHFQNSEPKYYSRIPHILDHLTYDETDPETGNVIIKRLSIYAIQLYRVIKTIAGDEGACWQHRDKIAERANMSAGSVTKAKEELQKSFHQLDGSPLIKVEEVKKTSQTNGTVYHKLFILDIWKWNNAFMATLSFHKKEALSPNDTAKPALSPNDTAPQGALSPGDTTKNKQNKNPLSKEQQPADESASVRSCCPLDMSISSVSVDPPPSEIPEDKLQAFNWFTKIGCDIQSALYFIKTFTEEDIRSASQYVEQQLLRKKQKNETIPNIIGYLRRTLENRWWIPRPK